MRVTELIIDVRHRRTDGLHFFFPFLFFSFFYFFFPSCDHSLTTPPQGFKSYAVRTVISGWDESFNSITGLNGSGKSNILDAICFVLGITNMSTVRAQNLQVSERRQPAEQPAEPHSAAPGLGPAR